MLTQRLVRSGDGIGSGDGGLPDAGAGLVGFDTDSDDDLAIAASFCRNCTARLFASTCDVSINPHELLLPCKSARHLATWQRHAH
jgi:hypothetical protein